jgi:hypothetical protein
VTNAKSPSQRPALSDARYTLRPLKAGGNIGASDSIADIFADETQIEMASSVATCPRYSLHVCDIALRKTAAARRRTNR